jgi:CBS domain-containing protein
MNPPVKQNGEEAARFRGRDWRTIQVQEIIDPAETRFVELDTSIEDTTKLLIRSGAPNVVLVRESRKTRTAIGMFSYDDLNAYLLLVLGMTQPDEAAAEIALRAREGETLALKQVLDHLGPREGPTFLPQTANLTRAMEMLGSGLHRIVVCKEGTSEAIGILSQLRLVRFFWENHQNFAVTEALYAMSLKDLEIGAKVVVAIHGEKPLSDALRLMHEEGITSLPVLDGANNVMGNISHVDTKVSLPIHLQTRPSLTLPKAPNRHLRHSPPQQHLRPLHLRHPQRTRCHGRQRLVSSLLRHALQHTRAYRRETRRHPLSPYVDRGRSIALYLRPAKSWSGNASRISLQHGLTPGAFSLRKHVRKHGRQHADAPRRKH